MCVCVCFCCDPGAWEWEHLQEAVAEKLKNSLAVAQLMDRIRSFLGRDKVSSTPLLSSPFPVRGSTDLTRQDWYQQV